MLENPIEQKHQVKIPKKYKASYIISDNIERINHILTFKNFEKITYQTSLTKAFSNQPLKTPLIFHLDQNTSLHYSRELAFTLVNYELPFDIQIKLFFDSKTLSEIYIISFIFLIFELKMNLNQY